MYFLRFLLLSCFLNCVTGLAGPGSAQPLADEPLDDASKRLQRIFYAAKESRGLEGCLDSIFIGNNFFQSLRALDAEAQESFVHFVQSRASEMSGDDASIDNGWLGRYIKLFPHLHAEMVLRFSRLYDQLWPQNEKAQRFMSKAMVGLLEGMARQERDLTPEEKMRHKCTNFLLNMVTHQSL